MLASLLESAPTRFVHTPAPAPRSVQLFDLVKADIAASEVIFRKAVAVERSPVSPMIQHLDHYRGKRLRPALLLLMAKAVGEVHPAHHTLAAVVEMIHTATLVHDDVLDDAETRRHVPTFHAKWGNKLSILLGDTLFTQAFYLTSTVDGRACQLIGKATNAVCAGELRQVSERGNDELSESTYFDILYGKTAALTEVSAKLGAMYAKGTPAMIDAAATYGRCLGLAFQVADDLLDLLGEEDVAGKTLGTDLEQGKLTLPIIHALDNMTEPEGLAFRELLHSTESNRRDRIVSVLRSTGSFQYTQAKADGLVRQARAALMELPAGEARTHLDLLAQWSIRRES
jgi:octaprenyl-diphosphate synthase